MWYKTGTTVYSAGGGRDVLIVDSNLPLHQSEAVARNPGQLTKKDKKMLQTQGVSSADYNELAIVTARHEPDKDCKIVGVMSGQLSREEVMQSIKHLLTTTQNDGGNINEIVLMGPLY